jgi:hypothetical protein
MNEHLKKGPLQKKGNSMQERTLSSQADLFHHSVILICELASLTGGMQNPIPKWSLLE